MCKFLILTLRNERLNFILTMYTQNKLYQNISVDLTKQAERIGGTKKSVSEEKIIFVLFSSFPAQLSLNWPPVLPFPVSLSPLSNPGLIMFIGLPNLPASNDLLSFPLFTSSLNTTWFI